MAMAEKRIEDILDSKTHTEEDLSCVVDINSAFIRVPVNKFLPELKKEYRTDVVLASLTGAETAGLTGLLFYLKNTLSQPFDYLFYYAYTGIAVFAASMFVRFAYDAHKERNKLREINQIIEEFAKNNPPSGK